MSTRKVAEPAAPTRFRCKVGGEWKSIEHFSQKQRNSLQGPRGGRRTVDAAHSGMTCRKHTSGPMLEERCDLCGLLKPLSDFSKSSRRNGVTECRRCIAWEETQEPDVIPAPLETGHISIEEQSDTFWGPEPKVASDFFPDDLMPQAPISSLRALGIEDADEDSDDGTFDIHAVMNRMAETLASRNRPVPSTRSSSSVAPPHLRGRFDHMSATATFGQRPSSPQCSSANSTCGSSPSVKSGNLPPHLRSLGGASSSAADPPSVSTATTMRDEQREHDENRRVSFNAWDPTGKQYKGTKAPTSQSSTVASSNHISADYDDPNAIGGWEVVPPVKKQPALKGKERWADSPKPRTEQRDEVPPGRYKHTNAGIDLQKRQYQYGGGSSDY